ncbi:hypothetical protein [Tabrizicola sp.]|uniref:hypothetical protein n=1 Tax=Tabrizicola sp. TaxID=2005166 RepID=UPI0035B34E6E
MIDIDFKSHRIWSTLSEVDSALAAFSPDAKADARFEDIRRKVDYLRWTLESSDPLLLSDPELQQIRNELQNLNNHLASDASNYQNLVAVSNIFSGIFARLPYPRVQRIFKSDANNIINDLRDRKSEFEHETQLALDELRSAVRTLKEDATAIQAQIGSSNEAITKLDAQIATKLQNWDSQFSADLSVKLAEVAKSYADFETERVSELRALLDELRIELDTSKKKLRDLSTEYNNTGRSLTDHYISEIAKGKDQGQKLLTEIAGIYDAAAQTALAGGFVEASIREKTLYSDNAWYAKLFFICGALSLAVLWLYHVIYETSGFSDILMRLPISIALFVPAIYFSSLAGKHRKTSVALQSLGLRIKAFDAYLLTADTEQKKLLRAEMANVFFDDARLLPTQSSVSESTIEKITDRLGSILEKLLDKIGVKGE